MDAGGSHLTERTAQGWVVAKCKASTCQARIIFARPEGTDASKPAVPYNADPSILGTTLLEGFGPTPTGRYIAKVDRGKYEGKLHVSHFATCPVAKTFRSRKR